MQHRQFLHMDDLQKGKKDKNKNKGKGYIILTITNLRFQVNPHETR